MADVSIPFNGQTLTFEIPDRNLAEILSPKSASPLSNLEEALRQSLDRPIGQKPLEKWVKPSSRVLIVSDDITRQTPTHLLIPSLIDRLNLTGIPDDRIECIMALGTHRYMSDIEMEAKVGPT
jgi:nickel-dependent lactate racemase